MIKVEQIIALIKEVTKGYVKTNGVWVETALDALFDNQHSYVCGD